MSNVPHENEALLKAALTRATKQFPEMDPHQVVKAVQDQHEKLMSSRPVVTSPMRDLRQS